MGLMVLEEHLPIQGGSSYAMCSIHPGYPSEDEVLQSAVDFTRAQGMVPLKYDQASESWVDDIAMSLGYVNASPKLQKPVDKFKYRYLVSSPTGRETRREGGKEGERERKRKGKEEGERARTEGAAVKRGTAHRRQNFLRGLRPSTPPDSRRGGASQHKPPKLRRRNRQR